jgi:hypothetical protein
MSPRPDPAEFDRTLNRAELAERHRSLAQPCVRELALTVCRKSWLYRSTNS